MMQRLVAFGTGTAIIRIAIILVAFLEACIIMAGLQHEIATNAAINIGLLLEDTTLEISFLFVMAAIGFGLISLGLSGIRKEELLELEVSAEKGAEHSVQTENALSAIIAQLPPLLKRGKGETEGFEE